MEGIVVHKNKMPLPDGRFLDFDRPLVMGIVNVTPDSFSDGGQYLDTDSAFDHARQMVAEGADIIDIGGESTRPGSDPVEQAEEIARVVPVIKRLRKHCDIPISVDTTKSEVAERAVAAGADMINDVSALRHDPKMVEVAAENKTPVVLMHMLGTPKTMQVSPSYADCVSEVKQFFSERIHFCLNYGIDRSQIILDPGVGFGKRLEDNLIILKRLDEFGKFECPVMLGASRKSFIQMITRRKDTPEDRLGGSLAAALWGLTKKANIIRVHDVAATVEAIAVAKAIEEAN